MKHKLKECIVCGTKFKPFRTTEKVCSFECAKKYATDWPTRKRIMKQSLTTRTSKINRVRRVFQQYIRERDKHLPCISCGTQTATKWDAGHYLKAELYTGLIFNENNCHKQCQRCNQYGGGMQIEYRIGLVERIGEDNVKLLESSKDNLRTYTWEDSELQELEKKYKKLLKSLHNQK